MKTQRGHRVTMEAETGICSCKPRSAKDWATPQPRGRHRADQVARPTPWCWTCSIQKCEQMNSCCLTQFVVICVTAVGNLYRQATNSEATRFRMGDLWGSFGPCSWQTPVNISVFSSTPLLPPPWEGGVSNNG